MNDELEIEPGPAIGFPDDNGKQYVAPPDAPTGPVIGKRKPSAAGGIVNVGDTEIEQTRQLDEQAEDAGEG